MATRNVVRDAHPTLSHEDRETLGELLQGMVVDLTDLSLLGKQYHWTLHGPRFTPLHRQLDEWVTAWREMTDENAERAVALGAFPDGQSNAVAAATHIEPVPAGRILDEEVVDGLMERLAGVIARARGAMDTADELDPVTGDLLHLQVQALEEQLWMIRSQR